MYPAELVAQLEKMGLKKDASDNEIKAFMKKRNVTWVEATKKVEPIELKVEPKKVEPAKLDLSAINDAHAVNLERIGAIEALEVSAAIKAKGIKENWTVDKVELEGFRDNLGSAPGVIVKKHENMNANILEASILLKSGYSVAKLEKRLDAKALDMADANRSISMKSLIAICCEMEGRQVPAIHAGESEWITAAFSTASVSGILSNIANKMLEMGFETSEDAAAIMKICKERSLNDLKQNTMYRMFTGSKLPLVPGGGPLQYDTLTESSKTIQAATHGKLIGITREMIINDDLGAFTQIAEKMGIDAFEQFADDGVAMIENATIFSAGNKNVNTGSETPSVAGYNAMRLLFAAFTETTTSTKLIGAKPQSVIVPAALFTAATSMFTDTNLIASGVGSSAAFVPSGNPFAKNYEVIEISRLASASTWFGIANPNRIPAFNVGFLNGRKSPIVEEVAVAPEFLGKAWRIVWDYGFAEGDYQGAVRMT